MKSLTRRTFLTISGGAGLGLVAGGVTPALAQTCSGTGTFINSNFNGTPIAGGDYIWFNSVAKVNGLGLDPVTIGFVSFIQLTIGGTVQTIQVPSSLVTFSPNVALATTDFELGQWNTAVPWPGLAGNVFLTGVLVQAPMPAGLPGGIKNIRWEGTFFSVAPDLTVQWKWAAAVYGSAGFNADYDALGVKPVDDNRASAYLNSDHAGTPENVRPNVKGGARGGGGSNFTGSYSGTSAAIPCDTGGGGGS